MRAGRGGLARVSQGFEARCGHFRLRPRRSARAADQLRRKAVVWLDARRHVPRCAGLGECPEDRFQPQAGTQSGGRGTLSSIPKTLSASGLRKTRFPASSQTATPTARFARTAFKTSISSRIPLPDAGLVMRYPRFWIEGSRRAPNPAAPRARGLSQETHKLSERDAGIGQEDSRLVAHAKDSQRSRQWQSNCAQI